MAEAPVITSAIPNAPGWITIAWAHSGNGGPLSFFIERQNPPLRIGPRVNNVDSYTDMGLQPSTLYSYRVCVIYPDGAQACSDFVPVQTKPPEPPPDSWAPPTITAQAVTPNSITIQWSGASYGHVNLLWRKQSESINRPQIPIDQDGRRDGSRHFPNLEPNTTYLFGIQGCRWSLTGWSCGNWSSPVAIRTAAVVQPPPPGRVQPIYAVLPNGDLMWNRHDGAYDLSDLDLWASANSKRVGTGWKVLHAFSGGDGITYAVMENGELRWNFHNGRDDGTPRWALSQGRTVGYGWQGAAHVFAGHDGVIYAVYNNGAVIWNRHLGRDDGTFRWELEKGVNVGNAFNKSFFWRADHVFSGGTPWLGIIYAVVNGDLVWFRHDGWRDGSARWEGDQGKTVGWGWSFDMVPFSLRNSHYVYVVMPDGRLLWNNHVGAEDGTFRWPLKTHKQVGTGWNVKHAFSG